MDLSIWAMQAFNGLSTFCVLLLMALGLAQCEDDERRARIAYIATLFLIEAYRSVPWSRMLIDGLGLS